MAKVPFSKLGLKVDNTVNTITVGEQTVEVIYYLPFKSKIELVANIINQSVDENNYYNPMKVHLYMVLGTVEAYTNLSFTAKQKEDPFKLYDMFMSSGLFDNIIAHINPKDWHDIQDNTWSVIKNLYDYKNSAMGILEMVSADYSNLNLDATNIQAALGDPENLTLLKEVVTKLG